MFVFCGGGTLRIALPGFVLPALDVPWHDGNSPGVDGTQVGIIKQPDKVCLCCFLETQYHRRLEPQVCLVVLGDLSHQPLEGQLAESEVLWFSESDECPSEPRSPLCTCGVSPVFPASSPRGSSSSAPESSPTRDGPARFFLSRKRCRGLVAFC